MGISYLVAIGFLTALLTFFWKNSKSNKGFLGVIILGIVGALTGGLLANLLIENASSQISTISLSVAVITSVGLLSISRLLNEI